MVAFIIRRTLNEETDSRFDRRGSGGHSDLENDESRRASVRTTPATTSASTAPGMPMFYLFHDPADQDEGCRRIYSFADRAERELTGKIEVRRPDVKTEKSVVDKYQVRVLPTILIVSPTGTVEERFEGEESATAARIAQALERLKATMR